MSDQALAWKAGFGALVLVFCAATYVMRKPAPQGPSAAEVPVTAPAAAVPALPPAPEPAPLDVQDDPPPVRVQVSLHDADPLPKMRQEWAKGRPAMPKARAAKAGNPRLHVVVAKRKHSPYAVGRKHYPYDPKDRWASRDAP